jgi:hypothetical protein
MMRAGELAAAQQGRRVARVECRAELKRGGLKCAQGAMDLPRTMPARQAAQAASGCIDGRAERPRLGAIANAPTDYRSVTDDAGHSTCTRASP